MAFQLAAHWGNRHTPRLAPRADALATLLWEPWLAAMPTVGGSLPLAPTVRRLVGSLTSERREAGPPQPTPVAGLSRGREPGSGDGAAVGVDSVNQVILRACNALAAHLLSQAEVDLRLPALPHQGTVIELTVRRVADHTYRVRPWPFAGRRLAVHTERAASTSGPDTPSRVVVTLLATGAGAD